VQYRAPLYQVDVYWGFMNGPMFARAGAIRAHNPDRADAVLLPRRTALVPGRTRRWVGWRERCSRDGRNAAIRPITFSCHESVAEPRRQIEI